MQKHKFLKGLTCRWTNAAPFDAAHRVVDGRIGHVNPAYNFIAKTIWAKSEAYIFDNPQRWRVKFDVIYSNAKHGTSDKIDSFEFDTKERHLLNELNFLCAENIDASYSANEQLAEGHKNKGVFKHVKYYVELL